MSEQRLIDANALAKFYASEFQTSLTDLTYSQYINAVRNFPTVEVVSVVHCSECIGWKKQGRKNPCCDIARMFGFGTKSFCSHGRKETEATKK